MKKIIILLIVICVIYFIFNYTRNDKVEENIVHNEESITEVIEVQEEKIDLNNLAEDQASFGKLDVPTYKKGEKDIKIPLLIYHAFLTPDQNNPLFSTQARFDENIKTLIDNGYTFLTLDDIYKYNQGKIGLPENNVTITMDDGWVGCYTEAFDMLKRYNVPATIFIVENLVGTEGYFTWEQAKEMYDSGLVKIHVHGQKHINATDYTSKESLVNAYNHTHELIEEKLGAKISKIMAYPDGKHSDNTVKWLKEAGFEIQVLTNYGTVNKSDNLDLTGLGRIRAEQASGFTILDRINKK